MRKDYFFIHDTKINYANETDRGSGGGSWLQKKFRHYSYFYKILNALAADGFSVQKDPEVLERSKRISRNYWIGKRGDLEFYAHKFPNGFEIEFFQNVNYKNPNGGRYDFDKFQKMPYIVRLQYQKYMRKTLDLLKSLVDMNDKTSYSPKLAEEWIKCRYAEEWHHEQDGTDYSLYDLDGLTQPGGNGLDRDRKQLYNGEIKYFRDYNGYLYRGRIYHNINNMWWVIQDKYTVRNVASFDLFDLSPDDCRRRMKTPKIPEEYQKRKQAINDTKTRELVAELRRRGVKVAAI